MAKRSSSNRPNPRTSSGRGKKSFGSKPEDRGGKPRQRKSYGDSSDKNSFSSGRKSYSKPKGKFQSSKSDESFGEKKSSFRKGKPSSSPRGEGPSFKKEFGDARPSNALRRERPYKKSDDSSGEKSYSKPKGKFQSDRKDESFGGKKSSFRKGKNFSSPRGEKPSFKKEFGDEGPSNALRRERPYKKFDDRGDDKKRPFKSFTGKRSGNFDKAGKGKTTADMEAPVQTEKVRLNKYIANSGVCSRREADELIKLGVISVNGKTITELGYKVNPGDVVRHESKVLHAEKPVYILMNKPKGFLTTTSDPQERNTVMHLIGNHIKERVYPVGRLDRNTTGLLLLTNDGDLADKLMHPSYNAKKIYKVELDRPLTKADAQQILDGVKLEEGKAMVDDLAIISDDKRTVGIEIHIGWNRVVRRIFETLNYEVIKLDRSVYAGLDKKDLGRGEWRFLTKEELVRLKHYK